MADHKPLIILSHTYLDALEFDAGLLMTHDGYEPCGFYHVEHKNAYYLLMRKRPDTEREKHLMQLCDSGEGLIETLLERLKAMEAVTPETIPLAPPQTCTDCGSVLMESAPMNEGLICPVCRKRVRQPWEEAK